MVGTSTLTVTLITAECKIIWRDLEKNKRLKQNFGEKGVIFTIVHRRAPSFHELGKGHLLSVCTVMATHSSIAWRIPWTEEPGRLQSIGSQRVGHDWGTNTHQFKRNEGGVKKKVEKCIRSDQISHSVVSDSLRPHELQHARPPLPSPTPGVHSDSRPSSRWCHAAISSSVVPFSSCPQSLPTSESFPMSQPFPWGGQSTGVSASASFLPKKSQGWSPSEWTGWISLQSKGLSRVFSNTTEGFNQSKLFGI